jgi:hypothetical protein
MGSFRSQPSTDKKTITGESNGWQYAATSMCGTDILIQDGDYIKKMPN